MADCSQFLEKRYDDPQWVPPEVIITWGQNPTIGCPDGFFGHWIVDCMKRGSKIIAVDPRNTWMTSRAVHHLQMRPGTDGALALGMLNVIINEGIYDKEFVAKWVHGFDRLKERVQQYPVDKVAAITEVPADEIIAAARAIRERQAGGDPVGRAGRHVPGWRRGRACHHLSVGDHRQYRHPRRAGYRPAGLRRDALIRSRPRNWSSSTARDLIKRLNEKRIGADKYPMVKNFRGWAQPDMVIDQIASGKPYPIKAAWIQTSNVVGGQAARAGFHYEALKKLDFVAVVDLFHNPTTMALADIILPAATFAEKDSIRSWWAPLAVITKRVQVGECKSDWEINFELAKRFNPDGMKQWNTLEDLFNSRLKPSGMSVKRSVDGGGWKMPPEGRRSRTAGTSAACSVRTASPALIPRAARSRSTARPISPGISIRCPSIPSRRKARCRRPSCSRNIRW